MLLQINTFRKNENSEEIKLEFKEKKKFDPEKVYKVSLTQIKLIMRVISPLVQK